MRDLLSRLAAKYDPQAENEACGIVLKTGKIIDAENHHEQPSEGFVLRAKVIVEHGDKVKGTWHTHPRANANLSQSDYAGFLHWPDLKHYVIGSDGVRVYEVHQGMVVEVTE